MRHRVPVLVALVALFGGCASAPDPMHAFEGEETIEAQSAPLGGAALAQRRREMERAYRDMTHYRRTLLDLRERDDRSGAYLLGSFLEAYLGRHLAPLLRNEWQSRHAELSGLDASLRLLETEVLVELRDPDRVQQSLDELERRYAGREGLLVDFPVGEQSTLGAAIESLRQRKWRG